MKLIALTILLLLLSVLSLVAPGLWQGFAILLIVVLLALDDQNLPPPE